MHPKEKEKGEKGEGASSRTPRSYLMFSCTLNLAAEGRRRRRDGPCARAGWAKAVGSAASYERELGRIKTKKVTT